MYLLWKYRYRDHKYGSDFWKYHHWSDYQTLFPLFSSHPIHWIMLITISFYKISSFFRFFPSVVFLRVPFLVILYFTKWFHLFIWISFNFYVNNSKIFASVIHFLFINNCLHIGIENQTNYLFAKSNLLSSQLLHPQYSIHYFVLFIPCLKYLLNWFMSPQSHCYYSSFNPHQLSILLRNYIWIHLQVLNHFSFIIEYRNH